MGEANFYYFTYLKQLSTQELLTRTDQLQTPSRWLRTHLRLNYIPQGRETPRLAQRNISVISGTAELLRSLSWKWEQRTPRSDSHREFDLNMETRFRCAINDAGLPRRRHPLRRRRHSSSHAIVVLTAFFIAVESQLAIIGHGIPISPNGPSPIPTPLLFDEEEAASIPVFVTMQLDDLVTTYRRHNENGEGDAAFADLDQWRRDLDGELEPKQTEDEAAHVVTLKRGKDFLQTRGSSALDDERSGSSDAALESLKAEVARQAGEIGGLTEELIADKKEIVELRVVVCNMMSALCDTKGSPCLPCPWRDLPTTTSAPTTTTTSTSPPPQTTTTTTMAKTTTAEPTTTTFTKPSTAPSTTTVKTTT